MGMRAIHVILIMALMTGGSFLMAAQDPQSHSEHHPQGEPAQAEKPTEQSDMMARCRQMMSQRSEMMQRMEAMDKKLEDLLAEMNRAKGNLKVDAVAKVVNEMAVQRKQMRQSMMQMSGGMMAHMMEHMMEHMQNGSAAMCPMMKEMMQGMMKGMDNAPKK